MSLPLLRWAPVDPDKPGGLHHPKLAGDVGWDLECMDDVTIPPMGCVDVAVNAQIHLPEGHYADIRNRSSMSRRGLYVDQNVIDNGYRGPLFVFIRNMQMPTLVHSTWSDRTRYTKGPAITLHAGERIAQLVFRRMVDMRAERVGEVVQDTERGSAGFGSTGK